MQAHAIKELFFMLAVVVSFEKEAVQKNSEKKALSVVCSSCYWPCNSRKKKLPLFLND